MFRTKGPNAAKWVNKQPCAEIYFIRGHRATELHDKPAVLLTPMGNP